MRYAWEVLLGSVVLVMACCRRPEDRCLAVEAAAAPLHRSRRALCLQEVRQAAAAVLPPFREVAAAGAAWSGNTAI